MADKSHTTNPSETERHHDDADPFVALWAERIARKAEYDEPALASKSREADEAFDRLHNIDKEIEATSARTLFGILVKLRVFLNIQEIAGEFGDADPQPFDESLFLGVISDLEQLVDTTVADRPSDVIKRGVFDLDELITESESCSTTMGKLAEYVEADHVRHSMLSVQTDLGSALIKMRRIHDDLHVAVGGVL